MNRTKDLRVSLLKRKAPTNARSKSVSLARKVLARAEDIYRRDHTAKDGGIVASFEIVYLMGWAPHASQQKPLEPGSAAMRLADALHTSEHAAGDKASLPAKPNKGTGPR